MAEYLSADEAAKRLGVSRQTLYSYVSRGLLLAREADDNRQSRYLAEAVERLRGERRRGRRPKDVAKATLDWGTPVLESALTLIQQGRLYYRGQDAVALARTAPLEEIAALLWGHPAAAAFPSTSPVALPAYAALLPHLQGRPPTETLPALLTAAASDDATAAWRQDPERLLTGCGDLVRLLFAAAVQGTPSAAPLHRQLADAWGLGDDGATLVRMALVLCADHELNASGFTARCIASTGASLRAAVIGGLCALSGSRHGATTTRFESFWNGLTPGDYGGQLRQRLNAGETIPGLGHPLYPEGDIRAKALLDLILPDFANARALVAAGEDLTGHRASVDFALVILRRYLGLPEGTAFILFALGRSVGWIAHALEQRKLNQLIRPRALYTGPDPGG